MSMPANRVVRFVVLGILLCAIGLATYGLFATSYGRQIVHDPHRLRGDVDRWVSDHRIFAPAIYVIVYIVVAFLGLPLWWLWMISGYTFGIAMGVVWSQLAGTIAAPMILLFSRWLAADWFHEKVEARTAKLHALMERLGHNGFLVVMCIRLMHVMPFGLSYYALGVSQVGWISVALGTLLGTIPSVLIYATLGYDPHLMENWRFVAFIATVNIALLAPVALRYLKPQWFTRIGLE